MPATDLPPVTDAHRQQAFALFGWGRFGWTYAAAMQNNLRAKLIEARAHQLRTREALAGQHRPRQCVRRLNAATGAWATQIVLGPYQPTVQESLTE